MDYSFNFSIPRLERPLEDALRGMPRAFVEQAQKGFAVLAEVGQQHYAEVLKAAMTALESKQAPLEDLEKHLALSKNDLGALFAASMLIVPILGESGTADEFAAAAVKVSLIPGTLLPKVRPFIDAVASNRSDISRAIRRAALPAQVLPYIANVEIVVDLRLAFEEGRVLDAVPVAVVHIDTDAQGGELWFQASRRQLERLKIDVDDALKQMDAAEAWSSGGPSS
jgi:hypothetical protein